MALSKDVDRRIIAKSEAKLLGSAEAEWEIKGWKGPLMHQMRTNASCLVNVPVNNNSSSSTEIQLRFHLKSYQCHDELNTKFCTKANKYVSRDSNCDCASCTLVPLKYTADIPAEFVPTTGTQSAGYSLLVDVLSPQENLMLCVSMNKLNGGKCGHTQNRVVKLESSLARQNLPVKENLWRMTLWTVDKTGGRANYRDTFVDTVDDALFKLTVTAYEMASEAKDSPSLFGMAATNIAEDAEEGNTKQDKTIGDSKIENPDCTETIKEISEPHVGIHKRNLADEYVTIMNNGADEIAGIVVLKAPLIEKSAFFRRAVEENSQVVYVNANYKAVGVVVNWMTKDELEDECVSHAEEICDLVANLLELDNAADFWEDLEETLISHCTFQNIPELEELAKMAEKYKLVNLTNYIQTNFRALKDQQALLAYVAAQTVPRDSSRLSCKTGNDNVAEDIGILMAETSIMSAEIAKPLHGSSKSESDDGLDTSFEAVEEPLPPQDSNEKQKYSQELKKFENDLNKLLKKLNNLTQ